MDAERVNDACLLPSRRNGPGNGVVFRQLNPIEIDHAPERVFVYAYVKGSVLQRLPGILLCGVAAPEPVGVDRAALILLVEDGIVDLAGFG